MIKRVPGPRPYRYRIQNDLVQALSDRGITGPVRLRRCDVQHTSTIRSRLSASRRAEEERSAQLCADISKQAVEPFIYKYHYCSRILDEAHLFTLLAAIRHRRKVSFLYFSPKSDKSYSSKNTNPLFERESEGSTHKTLPIKVIYDHQYGRWYLLSQAAKELENIVWKA